MATYSKSRKKTEEATPTGGQPILSSMNVDTPCEETIRHRYTKHTKLSLERAVCPPAFGRGTLIVPADNESRTSTTVTRAKDS